MTGAAAPGSGSSGGSGPIYGDGSTANPFRDYADANNPPWAAPFGTGNENSPFSDTQQPVNDPGAEGGNDGGSSGEGSGEGSGSSSGTGSGEGSGEGSGSSSGTGSGEGSGGSGGSSSGTGSGKGSGSSSGKGSGEGSGGSGGSSSGTGSGPSAPGGSPTPPVQPTPPPGPAANDGSEDDSDWDDDRDDDKGKEPEKPVDPVKVSTNQLLGTVGSVQNLIDKLKKEGAYVSNATYVGKVWYNLPIKAQLSDKLFGTERMYCQQALEKGNEGLKDLKEAFGKDVKLGSIFIERNGMLNHTAKLVEFPNGDRYVVDIWQSMVDGIPRIFAEKDWTRNWTEQLGGSPKVEKYLDSAKVD